MAQEPHCPDLSEFQPNLFLHPFLPHVFLGHSFHGLYFYRIAFSNGHCLSVTDPASMTILFHTGGADLLFEASLIFLPEKVSIDPCVDKRPRGDILEFSLPGVEVHLQSRLLNGLFPQRKTELITPTIEAASQSKGFH